MENLEQNDSLDNQENANSDQEDSGFGNSEPEIEGGFDFFDNPTDEEPELVEEEKIPDEVDDLEIDDDFVFQDGGGDLPDDFKEQYEETSVDSEKSILGDELDDEALEISKLVEEEVKKSEPVVKGPEKVESQLGEDVRSGLKAKIKNIDSKYFYDEKGSKLFESIMKMPEYYLTQAEYEIIDTQKNNILGIMEATGPFNLIEFGPGNGFKTKVLLKHFMEANTKFTYFPVDLSWDAMLKFERELNDEFPMLPINPINEDYTKAVSILKEDGSSERKVIMFMGSNIGNMTRPKTIDFLTRVGSELNPNDLMMIGFDLKKSPAMIMNAYKDPHGITSQFNLNLLERINRECHATFDLNNFEHHASYNPITGAAMSYLVALKKHKVDIPGLRLWVEFEYGEPIVTEISQKFDRQMIESLAVESGFKASDFFFDGKNYFTVAIFVKQ